MKNIYKAAAIVASAAAGIAVGMLSAPKSGKETRKNIKKKVAEVSENGINVDALQQQFLKQKELISNKAEKVVNEFNEFVDDLESSILEEVEKEIQVEPTKSNNDLLFEKISLDDIEKHEDQNKIFTQKIKDIKIKNAKKVNLKDLSTNAKKRTSSLMGK